MINILLNPTNVLIALIAAAVITPIAAYAARGKMPLNLAIVLGALGPFALLYWFFHGAVLAVVGFDSIFSVMIVLGVAGVLGWFAGGFAAKT